MDLGKRIWERADASGEYGASGKRGDLSRQAYASAVCGFTVYGLLLSTILAYYTMSWHPTSIIAYLAIGLAIPIIGIIIACASSSWPVSLLGYTMVVTGLGIITGPTVALYETGVVMTALAATAGVTVVTSMIGILYPGSLEKWGMYLFGGLLALLFVRFGQVIMAAMGVSETLWYMPWIEYLAALLFSLYIIYDWNRALRLPHTLDNAVDCSLAIYLDIINLFITFLRIFGGRGSSKD